MVDLSKIGGVRTTGQQGNRKAPKQTPFVNISEPVPETTRPSNLDARGITGIGAGLEAAGGALTNFAEEEQRQQAALMAAERKRIEGEEADKMAELLQQAETEHSALLDNSDLTTLEGREQYTLKFGEIDQKYADMMQGSLSETTYKTKLNITSLKASKSGATKIKTSKDAVNIKRATDNAFSFIAQYPIGTDPNVFVEEGLIEDIDISAGGTDALQKRKVADKVLTFAVLQRMKVLGDPAADPAELSKFLKDPLTLRYLNQANITEARKELKAQKSRRFENSPEGLKLEAENRRQKQLDEAYNAATAGATGPDLVLKSRLFYLRRGLEWPLTTLNPGQVLTDPTGGIVAEGKRRRSKVTAAKPDEDVFFEDPDTGDITVRKGLAKAPEVNPDIVNPDGSLTLKATKELTSLAFKTIAKSDNFEGGELRHSQEQVNFMESVEARGGEILKEGAPRGMTPREAIVQALIEAPDKPEGFNYVTAGEAAFNNAPEPLADGTLELTHEGVRQLAQDAAEQSDNALAALRGLEGADDVDPLDLGKATDLMSRVGTMLNSFFGQFSDSAVDIPLEKARLNFALLSRDFVRLFSLNPRFVVKEQILLEKLFPSPSVFTTTAQAEAAISELKREMLDIKAAEELKLVRPGKHEDKNTALDALAILGRIDRRIKRFEAPGRFGAPPTEEQPIEEQEDALMKLDAKNLTDKEAIEFNLQDPEPARLSVVVPDITQKQGEGKVGLVSQLRAAAAESPEALREFAFAQLQELLSINDLSLQEIANIQEALIFKSKQ